VDQTEIRELPFSVQAKTIVVNSLHVRLLEPEAGAVQAWYEKEKQNRDLLFPYWAKLWPAALALSRFIAANSSLVAGKEVLEIAAGLGLPSLVAARWAQQVTCTDIAPEAMTLANLSARQSGLHNFTTALFDWNEVPLSCSPGVLLLSDINYEPAAFERLHTFLTHFLEQGTVILLSTPQRLLAKPFILRLLPYCTLQHTETVADENSTTEVSIYVLQQQADIATT